MEGGSASGSSIPTCQSGSPTGIWPRRRYSAPGRARTHSSPQSCSSTRSWHPRSLRRGLDRRARAAPARDAGAAGRPDESRAASLGRSRHRPAHRRPRRCTGRNYRDRVASAFTSSSRGYDAHQRDLITRAGVRVSDIGAGLAPRTRTRSGRRPQGCRAVGRRRAIRCPSWKLTMGGSFLRSPPRSTPFLTRPLDRSSYGAAGHWIAPLRRPDVGSQPGTAIIVRRRAKRQGCAHVSRGDGRFGQRRLSQVTHRPEREEGRANRPALLPSGAFLSRSEQGVTSASSSSPAISRRRRSSTASQGSAARA
jgi:hypothetical protein